MESWNGRPRHVIFKLDSNTFLTHLNDLAAHHPIPAESVSQSATSRHLKQLTRKPQTSHIFLTIISWCWLWLSPPAAALFQRLWSCGIERRKKRIPKDWNKLLLDLDLCWHKSKKIEMMNKEFRFSSFFCPGRKFSLTFLILKLKIYWSLWMKFNRMKFSF